MTDTPQLLLAHHLTALKLPTFLREYDKLARQCASGASKTAPLPRPLPTKLCRCWRVCAIDGFSPWPN